MKRSSYSRLKPHERLALVEEGGRQRFIVVGLRLLDETPWRPLWRYCRHPDEENCCEMVRGCLAESVVE